MKEWEAKMPPEDWPPDLAKRAILIRGPSQSHWYGTSVYNEDVKNLCNRTGLVQKSEQSAIPSSLDRKYSYWVIVFPEGVVLENLTLSGNETHISKGTLDMIGMITFDGPSVPASEKKYHEFLGTDVYWRIALKTARPIENQDDHSTKKRFAKSKNLNYMC